jgi:predicted nucleotidyltransferase
MIDTASIPSVLQPYLPQIESLCREFGVLRLEAFGSVVRGDFDLVLSDLGFLVTYPNDYDYGPWLERYQELHRRLVALFGRPVDLIMSSESRNPHIGQSIRASSMAIYGT